MKKRFLLVTALTVTALGISSAFVLNNSNKSREAKEITNHYILDDTNGIESDSYGLKANHVVGFMPFEYILGKKLENGHVSLAPHGALYNYSNQSSNDYGAIHGIKSIKVTFTGGALNLRIAKDSAGKIMGEPIALTSGSTVKLRDVEPNFFRLEAGDSAVDISSVDIEATCHERTDVLSIESLGRVYTGVKNDIGYKLTVNAAEGTFAIDSLNKETNDHFDATGTVDEGVLTLTIGGNTLQLNISSDASTLTVDSSVGIGAMFAGLSLKEVYSVDNYESYAATGVGYDNTHAITATSGLRSAFHSDYYNTGSGTVSLVGDPNWKLMGSSDYITLGSGVGHNGGKAAIFKASGNGLRYVSMNSFMDSTKTMGKGTKFSFWAHGAVSNLTTQAASSVDYTVKVRLFTKNPITGVNDTNGAATEVTIPAGSGWEHYEITLDSTKEYYGYSFYIKNSTTGYIPIDDVEIYSTNPYMEYVAPVATTYTIDGTYRTSINIPATSTTGSIIMGLDKNGKATVKVSGADAGATSYTYNSATRQVTIPTTGFVSTIAGDLTYGNIVATLNESTGALENLSCTGTIGSYVENNGSLTATRPTNTFECDGTTGELQSQFKRRYDNGSGWQFDTSNADRIVANTDSAVGSGSLKFRCLGDNNTSHKTALTLANDVSYTGVGNIAAFVKNDTGVDFVIRIFIYKGAGMQNNSEIGSWTIPSNGEWGFYQMGFNLASNTFYNFQFFVGVPSGVTSNFYPLFDNITIW